MTYRSQVAVRCVEKNGTGASELEDYVRHMEGVFIASYNACKKAHDQDWNDTWVDVCAVKTTIIRGPKCIFEKSRNRWNESGFHVWALILPMEARIKVEDIIIYHVKIERKNKIKQRKCERLLFH